MGWRIAVAQLSGRGRLAAPHHDHCRRGDGKVEEEGGQVQKGTNGEDQEAGGEVVERMMNSLTAGETKGEELKDRGHVTEGGGQGRMDGEEGPKKEGSTIQGRPTPGIRAPRDDHAR